MLDEHVIGEVAVDCCPSCLGTFFDGGELEEVSGGRLEPFLSRRPQGPTTPRCPRCVTVTMRPYRYRWPSKQSDNEELEVDFCPECHGYWLDEGELEPVKTLVQDLDSCVIRIDDVTAKQYLVMLLAEIPLVYNERSRHRPWATIGLLGLNLVAFALSYSAYAFALDPEEVRRWAGLIPLVLDLRTSYMLLTYQFSHASVSHLLGNLYLLYVFGKDLELRWGRWRYLAFYLITGALAGLGHAWHTAEPWTPLIGASGAIAGLLGAYLVTFPKARVGLVFFFVPLRMRAFLYLVIYFIVQLLGVLGERLFDLTFPVSTSCHATGFVVGILLALLLRVRMNRAQSRTQASREM